MERMSQPFFTPLKWLTTDYSPHPEERSFLERAHARREGAVESTVAVPSDGESQRIFGVRLARDGLQAVWLEVVNGGEEPLWLDRVRFNPNYYTPQEAANIMHFGIGRRLVEFGLLGWLFLPLLPLLPLKIFTARAANQRLNKLFRAMGFPSGVIPPGNKVSGFMFTPLDEAVGKRIDVVLLGRNHSCVLSLYDRGARAGAAPSGGGNRQGRGTPTRPRSRLGWSGKRDAPAMRAARWKGTRSIWSLWATAPASWSAWARGTRPSR